MSKKNIFAKFQDYVNKPKRNVFDLSFGNNLTTKFGQLTPVFCKECIPGDSFKIHSRFALQFMPMKFPIQTPMRAYLHFFYVRNRTLWNDWMDFIGKTKDNLTLPYVNPVDKKKFFRVGGLADYLGVPNVLYGDYGQTVKATPENGYIVKNPQYKYLSQYIAENLLAAVKFQYGSTTDLQVKSDYMGFLSLTDDAPDVGSGYTMVGQNVSDIFQGWNTYSASILGTSETPVEDFRCCFQVCNFPISSDYASFAIKLKNWNQDFLQSEYNTNATKRFYLGFANDSGTIVRFVSIDSDPVTLPLVIPQGQTVNGLEYSINVSKDLLNAVLADGATSVRVFSYHDMYSSVTVNRDYYESSQYVALNIEYIQQFDRSDALAPIFDYSIGASGIIYDDEQHDSSPYESDIHLNALPFRAYEAIYNSYYRNAQNNPFIVNGVPEYNKYLPTSDGGVDTYQYDLHQRNWEYDFLTSAVQTPQQGDIAPLVGISVTGEATFQDENGNTYYASAQYDSDGNITGWTSHSPDMPQGSLRLLMDMAGSGISINDLRNVNAFQKFLENNIRHGLKYRDQIKSHFGVDVRYDELDMPEFIGGCSTDVNINKLSQTSESGDTPLGSFVGQASAYGESKHDITHYCDEHGFIIGILSVVPIPVYSQLLPKYFVKNEQLDYYFPEFGHLGYQPILQKEVSPLQTYYAGDNLNGVFGYNRAWYDYLDSTDEVHAQFRTTMRDFIMNRTFDSAPELGEDFLLVDPNQLNDVFLSGTDDSGIYDADTDKIIGSMYFNVSKKSPIPLFGIPKLD